jgi:hypothetical protein
MAKKKWLWLLFDRLGKYQLNTPISIHAGNVTKLERYEEEESDTYSIDSDELGSKLFVSDKDGLIKGIQSCCSFIYQDYEFIGKPVKDVIYFLINTFGQPLYKYSITYYMYLTPLFEIRVIEMDNKVDCVVILSWGNSDSAEKF